MKSKDWQSIAIPIILMTTGIALLGGNFLGFLSLARIENLWPAAVIAIGVIELLPWLGRRSRASHARVEVRDSRSSDVRQVR
ncbi:MAG TPA: hypothetical protein VF283_08740 [Bryobacteraceae bacterium]